MRHLKRRLLVAVPMLVVTTIVLPRLVGGDAADDGGSPPVDAAASAAREAGDVAPGEVVDPTSLTLALVVPGGIGDGGWAFAHDIARQDAEAATGVSTVVLENVGESGDALADAIRVAADGIDIVMATAVGYHDSLEDLATEFPEITFVQFGGTSRGADNLVAAGGRMYEARYVTGMVAAHASETGRLGFVAPAAVPEVVQEINAFALGAQAVDATVVVDVEMTGDWLDAEAEALAAQALLDRGADVVTSLQHSASTATGEAAAAAGARWISYGSDMRSLVPDSYLTAVEWNWTDVYVSVVNDRSDGELSARTLAGSMRDGVVGVGSVAPSIGGPALAAVGEVNAELEAGTFDVFAGPILDAQGVEVVAAGQVMSDDELRRQEWFVAGVVFG